MASSSGIPRWTAVLIPAGYVFGLVAAVRRRLYSEVLRQKSAPVPVISIGNITVGGTGKTPFVIMLSQKLADLGRSVAVVTRGYGRTRKDPVLIVSTGSGPQLPALEAGDEAVLISEKTRGIPVICAFDRWQGCRYAASEFGSDCIVLDDAFQHLSLARDIDIVLIDAESPYGNGRLLPAGHLRERPSALEVAQMVVRVARWPVSMPARRIAGENAADRPPVLSGVLKPSSIEILEEKKTREPGHISGKRVNAVSGIAKPESFERMLREIGAEIVSTSRFPDHHKYSRKDIAMIREKFADGRADLTVTTEKDACKLVNMLSGVGLSVLTLEVDLGADMDKVMDMVLDAVGEKKV